MCFEHPGLSPKFARWTRIGTKEDQFDQRERGGVLDNFPNGLLNPVPSFFARPHPQRYGLPLGRRIGTTLKAEPGKSNSASYFE